MFWKNREDSQEMTKMREDRGALLPGPEESEMGFAEKSCAALPEPVLDFSVRFLIKNENQIGRVALILAATTEPREEKRIKGILAAGCGWKSVATEVGGLVGSLPQKVTRAVVGAALNAEVVVKCGREMHALMHATLEASHGFVTPGMLEASIGAKIAIVRNNLWIAVAVVGDSAYHAVAHHERCGLGVMHI